jgi:sulfatase maturation enzyme AslB (radical SAM superfamily)
MESIEIAKKYNLFPDLLFTFTDENINYVPEIQKIAIKNKLVLIIDPVFSTNGTNLLSDETINKAKKYAKLPAVYLNFAHLILRGQGGNNVEKPTCKAIDSTIVIMPDNTLALPCYHRFRVKLDINGDLESLIKSKDITEFRKLQGKLKICEHCHINCYMDPSYQYKINRLFFASNISKLKYAFYKYIIFNQKLPF